MEAEHIKEAQQNVDAMFFAEMPRAELPAEEAMRQIGTIIVKAATDDAMSVADVKATMQYAYHMATQLNEWAENEDLEHVSVPTPLAKAVEECMEGELQQVIPISEALDRIAKKLAEAELEPAPAEPERTEKAAVAWGPDMAASEQTEDSWGPDPRGLRD